MVYVCSDFACYGKDEEVMQQQKPVSVTISVFIFGHSRPKQDLSIKGRKVQFYT